MPKAFGETRNGHTNRDNHRTDRHDDLAALQTVRQRTRHHGRDDQHNHGNHRHGGNRRRGILYAQPAVFLQNIQLIAGNHVPTQDKQQSAHQCQVKISAILGRRNERTQQLLDVELCGGIRRLDGSHRSSRGAFARPDQHGHDTGDCEQCRTDRKSGAHVFNEFRSEERSGG